VPTEKRRSIAAIEIGVLALLMALANLILAPHDPGFMSLAPHPMLFLTLLVLARYGFFAGTLAAVVFAVEYLALVALLGPGLMHAYLFAPRLTTPLVLLVPTAVFLGMLVQRHLDRARKADERAAQAAAAAASARAELAELHEVNAQLVDRIMHADTTLLSLLEQLKSLSTLDRARLGEAVLRLLQRTLRVQAASLWDVEGRGLALRQWHGERPPVPFAVAEAAEHAFDGDLLLLHKLPADERGTLPLMLGRFRAGAGGAVIGYLAIDQLALGQSAETARLFALVVEWMSIAAGHAHAFERLAREQKRLKALA
jgi:hypothetical protein